VCGLLTAIGSWKGRSPWQRNRESRRTYLSNFRW